MAKHCLKCGDKIPNMIIEGGCRVNITGRKFCFSCNPKRRYPKPEYSWTRTTPKKRKQILVEMLGGKCAICNYDKCLNSLDFHHVDENGKKRNVSQIITDSYVQACREVGKCILLCSNCHRELHADLFCLLLK